MFFFFYFFLPSRRRRAALGAFSLSVSDPSPSSLSTNSSVTKCSSSDFIRTFFTTRTLLVSRPRRTVLVTTRPPFLMDSARATARRLPLLSSCWSSSAFISDRDQLVFPCWYAARRAAGIDVGGARPFFCLTALLLLPSLALAALLLPSPFLFAVLLLLLLLLLLLPLLLLVELLTLFVLSIFLSTLMLLPSLLLNCS